MKWFTVDYIKSLFVRLRLKFMGGRVFYINGPQTLPPPLTKAQEEECLHLLSEGDKQAREKLITHNLRLVVYIAKKFENTGICVDDLASIGTIGLIKAVNTFCPEKNIKLATYASRCIENEILMYLRKASNRKTELSFDEPLNVDHDGNELLLSDVLTDQESVVDSSIEYEEEKNMLHAVVNALNERERMIINMRFGIDGGEEHTQKEVADILGISQSYISRLEKRILEKIKRELEAKQ
ncbi:MAG: RNA polymerase sporulation sigma factor SigE [Clostridia bacterium]|nr:RNA polymerase sporulation sigma factor SigE [Clostridia bacterium]